VTVATLRTDVRPSNGLALAVASLGCLALAARPPIPWVGFGVTISVGFAGVVMPAARDRISRLLPTLAATAFGIAAFASIRLVSAIPPMRPTPSVAFMLVGAAIAEELFFRRFMYGAFEERPAVAIVVTSLAFGLVHIPAYGAGVFPLDLAAGLVLGWQRWATRSWTASAASHVAANLMAIL
jgi:membrane protease YdiL (CAAX protease family)